jgi:hypothetical protein
MWLAMASRKIITRPIVLESEMIRFPTSPVKIAVGP